MRRSRESFPSALAFPRQTPLSPRIVI
jgi:hypothetical protein